MLGFLGTFLQPTVDERKWAAQFINQVKGHFSTRMQNYRFVPLWPVCAYGIESIDWMGTEKVSENVWDDLIESRDSITRKPPIRWHKLRRIRRLLVRNEKKERIWMERNFVATWRHFVPNNATLCCTLTIDRLKGKQELKGSLYFEDCWFVNFCLFFSKSTVTTASTWKQKQTKKEKMTKNARAERTNKRIMYREAKESARSTEFQYRRVFS